MTKNAKNWSLRTKDSIRSYLKELWQIINRQEMAILPGQLAFFMLLSLVPIITLCVYIAGFFNINMASLVAILDKYIPGGTEVILPYISGQSLDFKLGLVFIWMFYLASNGCNTVIICANQIYGINSSNFFKRRIKAIFMTLSILLLIVFILVVPVYGMHIIEATKLIKISKTVHIAYDIFKGPITWLLMFVFLRAIYEFAPDRVRSNSHLNTGALFTSIGWVIVTYVYSFLAKNITAYNVFYGALSNIAFLMLWLYFMSFVFVIGLCLNYGEELDKESKEKSGAIKIVKVG